MTAWASATDLRRDPDAVAVWIKLDLLTRRVRGARPGVDEERDKLMVFRQWPL